MISENIKDFIKKNFLSAEKFQKIHQSREKIASLQISPKKIEKFEKNINYTFKEKQLLINALTHSSINKINGLKFERLEFLGDRLLNLNIAQMLFFEYPDMNESEMTPKLSHMICREKLFEISEKIELKKYALFKSQNQEKKIFADMIEAIIGAIYIDDLENGQLNVSQFIHKYWYKSIDDKLFNPRSELQEILHKYKLPNPYYDVKQINDTFVSTLKINIRDINNNQSDEENIIVNGNGRSRKIANTEAAKKAVEQLSDFLKNQHTL